jgi:hypothetical protein
MMIGIDGADRGEEIAKPLQLSKGAKPVTVIRPPTGSFFVFWR